MTTVAASRPAPASAWFPLAARELRRYVTNPVFLAGVVLAAYGVWTSLRTVAIDVDSFVTFPATYLGGFGVIAAFWLTRSMHRSSAVVDIAPTEMPARTAAICAVAVVPFLLSLIDLVVIARFQPVAGSFAWGTFSASGRAAVLISQIVLPALGGPLLGVALGRWVRFPGAGFVFVLLCWGWMTLGYILSTGHHDAVPFRLLRLFSPFTFFTFRKDNGQIVTWGGQPWCYAGWQLCLCAIALLAAMLRGADGVARRRILGGLAAASVAAVVLYALAVAL